MSIARKINGSWQEIAGATPVDIALSSTSTNPVQNRVIYGALQGKANTADLGSAANKNFTTSVTSGSADVITSGGVYTYVDTVITQALNGSY